MVWYLIWDKFVCLKVVFIVILFIFIVEFKIFDFIKGICINFSRFCIVLFFLFGLWRIGNYIFIFVVFRGIC